MKRPKRIQVDPENPVGSIRKALEATQTEIGEALGNAATWASKQERVTGSGIRVETMLKLAHALGYRVRIYFDRGDG